MDNKRDFLSDPYKILIVDDDPLVVKTLERLLHQEKYLFHSVTNGEQALGAIQEIKPDIVLLDVFMPGINGYDVCAELKRRPASENIPVIFLTSNNDPDDIIKGFKAGAVDYITKPFNKAELLIRIETHLQLKSAREEIKAMNLIKTKFFSIMTNDIRDTLIGVKGVANFLNQELTNEVADNNEALKLSQILLSDSEELYKLLENLIEWAHIEIDVKNFYPRNIAIREIFENITTELNPIIKNKLLTIDLNLEDGMEVATDQKALNSILIRVVHNAVKYSYKGGKISITARKENNLNSIEIEDQGIGMEAAVVDNIFKLDTPHPKTIGTNQEKGTGLGLIICKTLVDKLKGSILIESQKHKGAIVVISLPDMISQ